MHCHCFQTLQTSNWSDVVLVLVGDIYFSSCFETIKTFSCQETRESGKMVKTRDFASVVFATFSHGNYFISFTSVRP